MACPCLLYKIVNGIVAIPFPKYIQSTHRVVKFLKTSLALIADNFHLDIKIEEILKKNLKISFTLLGSLLANASGQVEFYTPAPIGYPDIAIL